LKKSATIKSENRYCKIIGFCYAYFVGKKSNGSYFYTIKRTHYGGYIIEGDIVTKLSVQTIQKIAKSLGIPMEELLR